MTTHRYLLVLVTNNDVGVEILVDRGLHLDQPRFRRVLRTRSQLFTGDALGQVQSSHRARLPHGSWVAIATPGSMVGVRFGRVTLPGSVADYDDPIEVPGDMPTPSSLVVGGYGLLIGEGDTPEACFAATRTYETLLRANAAPGLEGQALAELRAAAERERLPDLSGSAMVDLPAFAASCRRSADLLDERQARLLRKLADDAESTAFELAELASWSRRQPSAKTSAQVLHDHVAATRASE